MSGKRALITGITGQDGSYLAELLLDKGYEVHGMVRRASTEKFERIEHLRDRITLHQGDLLDHRSLVDTLRASKPDEVYNLAAMSFVGVSWIQPTLTAEFTGVGVTRLLECIREVCPDVRFYQASSSEMFGKVLETPQTETTPFYPRSPYGVAKVYAHHITVNYRESYDMFLTSGILFNHESERRGLEFVTRKVTWHAAAIKLGLRDEVALGNLEAKRDWGYAKDYVEAMWLMLQHDKPDDFVIATGETNTVQRLVEVAFDQAGVPWESHVKIDDQFKRPGRGRPAGRRRVEGRARAGLEAADELRAADPADGRRRPEAAAGRHDRRPHGLVRAALRRRRARRAGGPVGSRRAARGAGGVGVGARAGRARPRRDGRRLRVRRRRGVPELAGLRRDGLRRRADARSGPRRSAIPARRCTTSPPTCSSSRPPGARRSRSCSSR